MNIFAPGSKVILTFDMVHPVSLDAIDPASANWTLFDDEGTELVSNQGLTVAGGEGQLSITIVQAHNVISGSNGARTAVLLVTNAAGEQVTMEQSYVLQGVTALAVPASSGMTMAKAMMVANEMGNDLITTWLEADAPEQKRSLLEAWRHVARLSFLPFNGLDATGVDNDIAEGRFRLNELTAENWAQMPQQFVDAVRRAQLIQAAVILGADAAFDRRMDGLLSKTVGESSEMFAARKPVSALHPKARAEIMRFLNRTITVGRA